MLAMDHGQGLWTSYYHINIKPGLPIGSRVSRGTELGTVGTNKPCGGRADGKHVHFTIWHVPSGKSLGVNYKGKCANCVFGGSYSPSLDGKDIGGWTPKDVAIGTGGCTIYCSKYIRVDDSTDVRKSYTSLASLKNYGRLSPG